MGNSPSAADCSPFNAEEFARLYKRFKKLDQDKSGKISKDEFLGVNQMNPLAERIFDILDRDNDGEVDFQEFIGGLSVFSVRSDKMEKLKFAFRIYDLDKDGFISLEDLTSVIKALVGRNLQSQQVDQICARAFAYSEIDATSKISFDDFCKIVDHLNVHQKMNVDI